MNTIRDLIEVLNYFHGYNFGYSPTNQSEKTIHEYRIELYLTAIKKLKDIIRECDQKD
jgi:hypothetical protein